MKRTYYFILSGLSVFVALVTTYCAFYAGQMLPEPCWRAELYGRECVRTEPGYIAFWSTVLIGSVFTIFAAAGAALIGLIWGVSND